MLAAETLTHFHGSSAFGTAADAAARCGVALAELRGDTRFTVDSLLPANWSHGNPIDIMGDAPMQRYVDTLKALLADPATGTLLFMHAPTAIVPGRAIAAALLPVLSETPNRLLACWLGDGAVKDARQAFRAAGVPCYDMPEQAVNAFSMLTRLRQEPAAAAANACGTARTPSH